MSVCGEGKSGEREQDASGTEGVPVCRPRAQLVHKIPDCHALGNLASNDPPPAIAQDYIIRCFHQFQAWQRGSPIENIRHLQQDRGSRIRNHERINLHPCRMGPCESQDTRHWSRIGQHKAHLSTSLTWAGCIRRVHFIRDSRALRISGI